MMTSRDFCYWLQGFFELNPNQTTIPAETVEILKKHLNMVFIHEIDPSFPKESQEKLNEAHGNKSPAFGDLGKDLGSGVKMRC